MTGYDVTLERPNGSDRTIEVGEGETVLEAAQRAGVRLPSDCRKGTCITCVGRVLAVGSESDEPEDIEPDAADDRGPDEIDVANAVDYRRPPQALEEDERADGYALLCIALPRADCRIRVGPRVRAEVGDSPWK